MSQQIPASIPSPVSPAVAAPQAAPLADQGSTSYPQWVATTQGAPSVATPQQQWQGTPVSVPSTNNQFSQSPSSFSPNNPWEAAMSSLERVVSQISPSPSQTAQYPTYQTVPQVTTQYNPNLLAQPTQYPAAQAPQTSYNNAYTTPTSYQGSTASPQLSSETAAVVNHFGIEAPGILNQYATTLEDALIQQQVVLDQVGQRAAAMEYILTDGYTLADYTDRYFTEVEPIDVQTEDGYYDQNGDFWPYNENAYTPSYDQLPAVPASASATGRPADPQTQWDAFGQVMNQSPDQAWRYLSQMSPDALRSKLLFMDQG
jgi:hypothetical protein